MSTNQLAGVLAPVITPFDAQFNSRRKAPDRALPMAPGEERRTVDSRLWQEGALMLPILLEGVALESA